MYFFFTVRSKKVFWDIRLSLKLCFNQSKVGQPHRRTQAGTTRDRGGAPPGHLTGWSCTQCGGLCPAPKNIGIQRLMHRTLCRVPAHWCLSPVPAEETGPAVPAVWGCSCGPGASGVWEQRAATQHWGRAKAEGQTGSLSLTAGVRSGELWGGNSLFPECQESTKISSMRCFGKLFK